MFYPEFIPVPGNFMAGHYVVHAYDPANGLRWTPSYAAPKSAFIYRNSIHCADVTLTRVYLTASAAWGRDIIGM